MSMKVTHPMILRIRRLFKSPRERVYGAWTKPEEIKQWFGPEGCRIQSVNVEYREGGKYHVEVDSERMGKAELHGVIREIKEPSHLVYTWNWTGNPELETGETLVTVDFVDKEGFTEVQLAHEGFSDQETFEDHQEGWNGSLDKLEQHLAAETMEQKPGRFGWNELITPKVTEAKQFYTQLFDWKAEEASFDGMKYTLFKKDGAEVGGMMKSPDEKMAPLWLSYVSVESADAMTKKVEELGGTIVQPPFNIPTVGRIAVFQDPQGAVFAVHQPETK